MKPILKLDPASYERHAIHGDGRCWAETNCYVDVLIELIHALGFDPVAALPFTIAIDFEVDQWTFFKYPHRDLLEMYGMHIEELNPWVSLAQHVEEQVNGVAVVLSPKKAKAGTMPSITTSHFPGTSRSSSRAPTVTSR